MELCDLIIILVRRKENFFVMNAYRAALYMYRIASLHPVAVPGGRS